MQRHALATFRTQWEMVAHTDGSRRVLVRLAAAEPSVRELSVTDLAELVDTISGRLGPVAESVVHPVVGALLRQFDDDPLIGMTLVRVLLPGLAGIARLMRWGAGGPWVDRNEFAADLVATAWRSLRAHAGQSLERPCRTVVGQVRRSMRTDRERHRRTTSRSRPMTLVTHEPTTYGSDELTELARGLTMLSGTLIERRDAALILANRVYGYRLSELSAETGESIAQLSYRRRRAEEAVCR
ncbi:MAG: hypothetical protein JWO62_1769 [Acidimicrobiaceae bacterium]|jgi:hypothetical protein|nr:hypothetical protein [Acidimicrobiaceae bacterium]